jgi:L-ascorbate metabolism protein UlaG (beta-lactamase superfamily)
MHVEWFGQSAFALTGPEAKVFIDPFADLSPLATWRSLRRPTCRPRPARSWSCRPPHRSSLTVAISS